MRWPRWCGTRERRRRPPSLFAVCHASARMSYSFLGWPVYSPLLYSTTIPRKNVQQPTRSERATTPVEHCPEMTGETCCRRQRLPARDVRPQECSGARYCRALRECQTPRAIQAQNSGFDRTDFVPTTSVASSLFHPGHLFCGIPFAAPRDPPRHPPRPEIDIAHIFFFVMAWVA